MTSPSDRVDALIFYTTMGILALLIIIISFLVLEFLFNILSYISITGVTLCFIGICA